jgi:hypothetical protein
MNNAGIYGMAYMSRRGKQQNGRRNRAHRAPVARRWWPRHGIHLVVLLVVMGLLGGGLLASAAAAIPPTHDPSEPPEPPDRHQPDFSPPAGGFTWRLDGRFGAPIANPDDPDGPRMVNFHYCAPERPNVNCRGDVAGNQYTYDPGYVHPDSLHATFDGCPTEDESSALPGHTRYRYRWQIVDTASDAVRETFQPVANCNFAHSFAVDGNGVGTPNTGVRLTITDPDATDKDAPIAGSPFQQPVVVRDYLVVSIGDSYGSGEGNPDIPQQMAEDPIFHIPLPWVVRNAEWQDKRCHRSAIAGPAQAAIQLERSDPHSSVTYLSFACSGANIENAAYKDVNPFDPYADGNQTSKGSGILDRYAGIDAPDPNNFDPATFLPDQITQVSSAVGTRKVDALVMSGGGNDIGFANVATACVMTWNCPNLEVTANHVAHPGVAKTTLDTRVKDDLASLGGIYDRLAERLDNSGLDIGQFYVTEYPDSTRATDKSPCTAILDDVIPPLTVLGLSAIMVLLTVLFPPLLALDGVLLGGLIAAGVPNGMWFGEVSWAGNTILPSGGATADHGLDRVIADAVGRHAGDRVPWQLVGGITADFQGTGSRSWGIGHGYCSSDRWIRTAYDSNWTQGPFGFLNGMVANIKTDGTLHPNGLGHLNYAQHIFEHLKTLLPTPPAAPAQFTVTDTNSTANTVSNPAGTPTVSSTAGTNGWLVGCGPIGAACPSSSDRVVEQIVAVTNSSTTVRGAGLTINGADVDCSTGTGLPSGVTCQQELLEGGRLQKWSIQFTHDGIYRLDATVTGDDDSAGSVSHDVNVDLHDPLTPSVSLTSASSPSNGWYNSTVTATFDVPDPGDGGSAVQGVGLQGIEYRLDGGSPVLVLPKSQLDPATPLAQAQVEVSGEGSHSLVFHTLDVGGRTSADVTAQFKIDRTPPAITVSSPTTATYTLNQTVAASYSCTDNRSGVDACTGTKPSGQAIETATTGTKTFAVHAVDKAGNVLDRTLDYKVGFAVQALYDQTKAHKAGSTVPIKVQLVDANGTNLSAAAVTVAQAGLVKVDNSASSVVDAATAASADRDFRYDASIAGYIYNLKTTGLTTGTWDLKFTTSADGVVHDVYFDIR